MFELLEPLRCILMVFFMQIPKLRLNVTRDFRVSRVLSGVLRLPMHEAMAYMLKGSRTRPIFVL